MSSTLVYHEFSHSQSQSQSSSLSLKLNNPSKLTFSSSISHSSSNNNNVNDAKCMWSAIETLSSYQKHEGEKEYVHPSAKRSSMSERSLEMCTESLGSETGAFFTDSFLCFSTTTTTTTTIATTTTSTTGNNNNDNNNKKPRRENLERNNNSNYEFPPPLTTMTGSNSLQVRPYREDGRLVIEVVSPPLSRGSCLKAERSDGRLRMSLVREREEEILEEEEVEEEEESGVAMEEGNLGKNNNNSQTVIKSQSHYREGNLGNNNNNIKEEKKEEGLVERRGLEGGVKLIEEDKNGKIKVEFRGKMGRLGAHLHHELSQRGNCTSCRCKEGGRGNMNMESLIKWEPFWVAT